MGVDRLAEMANKFGIGHKSGIEMEHEKSGLTPTKAWKKKRYNKKWQNGETLSVAIGQGFDLVTPLQICLMTATIANGGKQYLPQVIEKVSDTNQTVKKTTKNVDSNKTDSNTTSKTQGYGNKIEVVAKDVDSNKTTVTAKNGVTVYYQGSTIRSETASYDKETKILVLDGKVEIIGYQGTKEHADHMEIHTKNNVVNFEKLFFVTQNDIWLMADKAHRNEGNYTLGRSVMSSCDIEDPLWTMTFSDSKYDSIEEYMKVYNAKISFLDVPVFYTPYLGFSLNKQRSSGLLSPRFGYSEDEGFLYEQPIFWAISPSMDLEIDPQIRTNRSVGFYSTFRFVDSKYSSGQVRLGYFRDTEEFQELWNTKDLEHYGAEFSYNSTKVFSNFLPKGYKDGLYVNAIYLNDVDYLNLQKAPINFGLDSLQESRLNYFLYNDEYYAGLNAKYFINTRSSSNDSTLQLLPAVQLHKYLDHILWDNLTYSVDLRTSNNTRKVGTTFLQTELKIPLEFTTSFFDDFLNVSIAEEFYYTKLLFGNATYLQDDFQYYNNIHKVKIFTDLIKNYDDFIHVIQPSVKYIKPGSESNSPVKYSELDWGQRKLFTVGLPEEKYHIELNQYFYTGKKTKLRFFQRIYQTYYPNREYKWSDLGNEMSYVWKKWSFYNNVVYSPEFSEIRELSSSVRLKTKAYRFTLRHTYGQVLPDHPESEAANDIGFRFSYAFNNRISFSGGLSYNIDDATSRQWKFGASYKRDCWSVATSIRQDITARPTGYTKDNLFYLQFNFIPFGGIGTNSLK